MLSIKSPLRHDSIEKHYFLQRKTLLCFTTLQMVGDSASKPTVLLEEKLNLKNCDNTRKLKINEGFKEFFSCMWQIE